MCNDQNMCNKHKTQFKTSATNVQKVQTYVQLIQMTNPSTAQATQTCMTIKLPIKQSETHQKNYFMVKPFPQQSWQDHSEIFPVKAKLVRSTNVGLPSSTSMLVVPTHKVPHPTK